MVDRSITRQTKTNRVSQRNEERETHTPAPVDPTHHDSSHPSLPAKPNRTAPPRSPLSQVTVGVGTDGHQQITSYLTRCNGTGRARAADPHPPGACRSCAFCRLSSFLFLFFLLRGAGPGASRPCLPASPYVSSHVCHISFSYLHYLGIYRRLFWDAECGVPERFWGSSWLAALWSGCLLGTLHRFLLSLSFVQNKHIVVHSTVVAPGWAGESCFGVFGIPMVFFIIIHIQDWVIGSILPRGGREGLGMRPGGRHIDTGTIHYTMKSHCLHPMEMSLMCCARELFPFWAFFGLALPSTCRHVWSLHHDHHHHRASLLFHWTELSPKPRQDAIGAPRQGYVSAALKGTFGAEVCFCLGVSYEYSVKPLPCENPATTTECVLFHWGSVARQWCGLLLLPLD